MSREHSPSDVLLYLISESGASTDRLKGRKKLMKLAFFLEYLEPSEDRLSPNQNIGSFDFEIFKYGPFSRDVLDSFDDLRMNRYLYENDEPMEHVISLTEDGEKRVEKLKSELSGEVKTQIEEVSERFGEQPGWELEDKSLDYLGISKREKDDFRGTRVEKIIDTASA